MPGDFYVAKGRCIICMLPVQMATGMVGFCDMRATTGSHAGSHCYFKRQPRTPEELELALQTLVGSCCGALRYAGSDPVILERLRREGYAELAHRLVERINAERSSHSRNTTKKIMLFDKPMVLHSKQADGRHWLTTLDMPPLQIWPVAPNHCRVGHILATLVSAKLAELKSEIPEEITLSRADVALVASLAGRYPELETDAGDVRVRLVAKPGPEGSEDEAEQDDDPPQFITPQPPLDWTGDYDTWIVTIGRRLGVDVPPPSDEAGYEKAMANAASEVRQRLPSLRQRFLAGMGGLNLGFKIGLTTRKGGKEYVWVRPTDWNDENTLVCVLESQPRDCKGYKLGQSVSDLRQSRRLVSCEPLKAGYSRSRSKRLSPSNSPN